MERTSKPIRTRKKLSTQVEEKVEKDRSRILEAKTYDGSEEVVSTGSTLLDLAITGGRFRGGGIPLRIFVEVFGESGTGKTVLLSQIAGNLQRKGGQVMFHDPEARLNKQFAAIFGLDHDKIDYTQPDTVTEVFQSIRAWIPQGKKDEEIKPLGPFGIFADSLAALSTGMELSKEEGDKMGMRRAKEFSEELRKTCRILAQQNALLVASNQVRQSAEMVGPKYKSPGGEAIGFYASLRLRCARAWPKSKIKVTRSIQGKDHERVIGVITNVEVHKSSVWKPFRSAPVYILFDYGIDDIRANLQYLKTNLKSTVYTLGERKLGKELSRAIRTVEEEGLEQELREAVIDLWEEIEEKFEEPRKPREW